MNGRSPFYRLDLDHKRFVNQKVGAKRIRDQNAIDIDCDCHLPSHIQPALSQLLAQDDLVNRLKQSGP